MMAWKKATALLFAVEGTIALHMKSLHTHLETPTLPATREAPQISQGAVAPIEIWAKDCLQYPMTNRPAIVWKPSWA